MSLVSTEWLNKNHSKVKIIDATWHMPNTSRKAYEEYKSKHIKNTALKLRGKSAKYFKIKLESVTVPIGAESNII